MPVPYIPPGVTITEKVTPQVVPIITSTAELVIVGLSLGHEERTDQFYINAGEAKEETKVLPFLEEVPSTNVIIKKVYSAVDPALPAGSKGNGFAETTDWTQTTEEITNKEGAKETVAAIKSVGGGALGKLNGGKGVLINVTYSYTPKDYFNPIRLFSLREVQQRFGNAFENGKIGSFLALGAQKAFENGARAVICQPVFQTKEKSLEYDNQGHILNAKQPASGSKERYGEVSTWETTLEALNAVEIIDLLAPTAGQGQKYEGSEITDSVQAEIELAFVGYEAKRAVEQQYVFGCFGEDGTNGTSAKPSVIRAHAEAIASYAGGAFGQSNLVVNTANFGLQIQNESINIGGQYVACAAAGQLASRPASVALTRKNIVGFLNVKDFRTPQGKNEDAEAGLLVVEEIKGRNIRVRDGLTTATNEGEARKQISVVRAKFNMIESIKETLENQIIGQIIADANSPLIVRSAIAGVLSALVQAGEIVAYETPVCKISSLSPATITASFSYRPAFTLNYIDIVFSLDLSSQTVQVIEQSAK